MAFNHMRTDHRDERKDDTPDGMIAIVRRELKPGEIARTKDGATYVAMEDGSVRRAGKRRMSKKERIARRRTVAAVRKARLEEARK